MISTSNSSASPQEIIAQLSLIIAQKDQQIAALEYKLNSLLHQRFASSSEKFPPNLPSLFEGDSSQLLPIQLPDPEVEEIVKVRKKGGGRTTPPKELPHIRIEHDLSEEEKQCECGCTRTVIKEIVSHQYDVVPAIFQVIENVRFVYGCSCGAAPITSPLSPQILPRHQVTPAFLATIAIEKFEDALPLERQAKIYKQRLGVGFTSTTLANWLIKASTLHLEDILKEWDAIQKQSGYIHADETTLQVLQEEGRCAKSKSWLWVKVSGGEKPIVLLHYSSNRSGATAEFLLEGFEGYLHTDGYPGYNTIANQEEVTQLGCWAHARRKFAEIVKLKMCETASYRFASEAIALVARLYKIEKEIKEEPPDVKQARRQEESLPILDTIRTWMETHFATAQTLGGAIAKAFVYLRNQFDKLCVYITDGRLAIDNNKAENHIRPIALGRKNWLFATSTQGAKALANWYSIIETAKANGLNPFAYLKYLLTELPRYKAENRDIAPLMPWNVGLEVQRIG